MTIFSMEDVRLFPFLLEEIKRDTYYDSLFFVTRLMVCTEKSGFTLRAKGEIGRSGVRKDKV